MWTENAQRGIHPHRTTVVEGKEESAQAQWLEGCQIVHMIHHAQKAMEPKLSFFLAGKKTTGEKERAPRTNSRPATTDEGPTNEEGGSGKHTVDVIRRSLWKERRSGYVCVCLLPLNKNLGLF
jgi:hypothetical protein